MNIAKKIIVYVAGLFFLSLGVSVSIIAGLGVSPVSSLAYSITLVTGITIGLTTILANILFIGVQIVIKREVDLRDFASQLVVVFLFGFFMDATLWMVQLLPTPETFLMQIAYLIVSLYIVSVGLFFYFSTKLPLMPYDALTAVISEHFNMKFSKAKVTSDSLNVAVAGAISLIFIHTLGSIGIGTFIAAVFIGKITGQIMGRFQKQLLNWFADEGKMKNEA